MLNILREKKKKKEREKRQTTNNVRTKKETISKSDLRKDRETAC